MARNMQDRMEALSDYMLGVEMYNDALIVRVRFPKSWKYFSSADGVIKATSSDSDNSVIFYYADRNNASYDDIFDLIEETVKLNKEVSLKMDLLRLKGEELKQLFSDRSYDELLTLEFVIKEKKERKKPGRKPKKKEEPAVEETAPDNEKEKVEDNVS